MILFLTVNFTYTLYLSAGLAYTIYCKLSYYNWRGMHTEKINKNSRQIIAVSLYELKQIMHSKENIQPVFKNINFEYLVFVARLVRKG